MGTARAGHDESLNTLDARHLRLKMLELLRNSGASKAVLSWGRTIGDEALAEFAMSGQMIRNADEFGISQSQFNRLIEDVARAVLKAHLKEKNKEMQAYLAHTNVVLVWIARLAFFSRWRTFVEFKRIVEGL